MSAILFMLSGHVVIGQGFTDQQLRGLEDEELLSLFNEVGADSIRQERIARVYLDRARKQKDTIKMARGYDRLARIFHPEKNIRFADSVIALTKDMDHITYPALGYAIKGYEYDILDDLKNSTTNFITAHELAELRNNVNLQAYVSQMLIFAKSIWGDKREALEMQKVRHELIKSELYVSELKNSTRNGAHSNIDDYHMSSELSSIQNFVFCYLNLKVWDSAEIFINEGSKKTQMLRKYNKSYFESWFLEGSAELNYYQENYNQTIKIIDKLLLRNDTHEDPDKLMNLYYFKGLSLIGLNEYDKGIENLEKSDSIFENNKVLLQPYDRLLFEKLLNHNKIKGNVEKQLIYLNKLLYVDSIFKENYLFFEPNLIRNFETPRLLAEKEILISNLTKKNHKTNLFGWTAIVLFMLSLSGLFYYFRRQQMFKKRFELLMQQGSKSVMVLDEVEKKNEISSEVIKEILDQLDAFEQSDQFISQDINLHDLAKMFGTNSRYLSRIINLEKEKNFSQYINELRLDYALKELSENPVFRKYTIKAIANECGFNRAEVFSKAFYKKFGIYPSFYLKKLEARKQKS